MITWKKIHITVVRIKNHPSYFLEACENFFYNMMSLKCIVLMCFSKKKTRLYPGNTSSVYNPILIYKPFSNYCSSFLCDCKKYYLFCVVFVLCTRFEDKYQKINEHHIKRQCTKSYDQQSTGRIYKVMDKRHDKIQLKYYSMCVHFTSHWSNNLLPLDLI